MKSHRKLPATVRYISFAFDACIVGSGAKYISGANKEIPADWDMIIDPYKWQTFLLWVIHQKYSLNSFGGFKIEVDDVVIDVWPEELKHFINTSSPTVTYIYKPHGRILMSFSNL